MIKSITLSSLTQRSVGVGAEQIAVIAYSPLCQGILAGKFRKLEEVPDDFRKNNRFVTAGQFPAVASFVGKLAAIAERLQKPAAAVALRWVLERQGLVSAIVGASSPAQVDQNLQALGWKLPSSEKDELDALSAPFSAGIKPHDSLWNWHPREKVAKFS
ncbi:MAG: hypothetical protein DCC75_03000 [Proteobacteria bacterium]|nr:MAG: hypothetical protein DCC75_03000 [Pseudomonadota bacterium]